MEMKNQCTVKQIFTSPMKTVLMGLGGIFIGTACSFRYILPDLIEDETTQNSLANAMIKLSKSLDGYQVEWIMLSLFFFACIVITSYEHRRKKENIRPVLCLLSVVFGLLNVSGLAMYYLDSLFFLKDYYGVVVGSLLIIGWSNLFYMLGYWADHLWEYIEECAVRSDRPARAFEKVLTRHIGLAAFCVIFLAWLPWIVTYYPASMDWDVYRQLNSFLGINGGFASNHDPWFSSCVLGIFYKIGVRLHSENIGVFLYVLTRDTIMAAIFSYLVYNLKKRNLPKGIYLSVMVFFAVTPVWGAYAKHAFKDTFGLAWFCLFIIMAAILVLDINKRRLELKHFLLYSVAGVMASLFRNNLIYAVAPLTIMFMVILLRRAYWRYCLILLGCLGIYFGYNHYIMNYGGVAAGSKVEALSIPLQQTARTVRDYSDKISDKEKTVIDQVMEYDSLAEKYNPILSDPIKDQIMGHIKDESSKSEYLKTWLRMFAKYPKSYVEAAVAQSYGYYAFTPEFPYWAGNYNSGMTIFNWIRTANGENYTFHYHDWGQTGREVLHAWARLWDVLPVLNLTDHCAYYTWSIVLLGYFFLRRKRYLELLPIMAVLLVILSCIASPVNDCFRYFAPAAVSSPALMILLRKNTENQEE
ncbi:MAG: DUF6020 family protein [Lachnospiraceae bacterium]|nr:DUF6020 family protein [Lachnospiraceae bacterium]